MCVRLCYFKFRFLQPTAMTNGFATCFLFFLFWFLYTDIGINIKYAQKYIIVFCLVFQYYSCVSVCLCVSWHFRARSPLQINHYIYTGYDPLVKLGACLFRFVWKRYANNLRQNRVCVCLCLCEIAAFNFIFSVYNSKPWPSVCVC